MHCTNLISVLKLGTCCICMELLYKHWGSVILYKHWGSVIFIQTLGQCDGTFMGGLCVFDLNIWFQSGYWYSTAYVWCRPTSNTLSAFTVCYSLFASPLHGWKSRPRNWKRFSSSKLSNWTIIGIKYCRELK